MKKLIVTLLVVCTLGIHSVYAQGITAGLNLGYATAQGEHLSEAASGGFNYSLIGLYHFSFADGKFSAGLEWDRGFLLALEGDDAGLYGIGLFGARAQYDFVTTKVKPFVALAMGVSNFETPTVTVSSGSSSVTTDGISAYGFGIKPELGLRLGGFVLSVAYQVPSDFDLEGETVNAGALKYMVGYAYTFKF